MTERRENIARALEAADYWPMSELGQDHYRRLADAAIAADGLQGRVLELAMEWEHTPSPSPTGVAMVSTWGAARRLRALLDGADSGSATT